jgi:protein-S-isoprenylcysteine O-methyltransferase Ste14
MMNLFKSILHNLGVLVVGLVFAYFGRFLDGLGGLNSFSSFPITLLAGLFLLTGFLIRVWATYDFYQRRMKVILLKPQKHLIVTGPYRFSRNPLYLGGNFFIFGGAVLALGSPAGLGLTFLELAATDLMIRREEKQLRKKFGKEFERYSQKVRRWL